MYTKKKCMHNFYDIYKKYSIEHWKSQKNEYITFKNLQPQIRKSWDSMENANKKRK